MTMNEGKEASFVAKDASNKIEQRTHFFSSFNDQISFSANIK